MEKEQALLRSARLEVIVPENTTTPLHEFVSDEEIVPSTAQTSCLSIKRRELLFIEEKVRVLVVVSLSSHEEQSLQSCLSRAELRVEAWAVDVSHLEGPDVGSAEPLRELVQSVSVPNVQDPIVLAHTQKDGNPTTLTLVWEAYVTLNRPRNRMPDPYVSLYSILLVTAATPSATSEQLLPPFEPLERNLLENMRGSMAPTGSRPFLSSSSLVKIQPVQPRAPQQIRLEYMSPRLRLIPLAVTRMSYSPSVTAESVPSIHALLSIEVVPFVRLEAEIQTLHVSMKSGRAEDLTPNLLPLQCNSGDQISFLYRLYQSTAQVLPNGAAPPPHLPNFDVLTITLEISINSSETCKPRVCMELTTNIDFFQALNPSYGGPSQPMQRPRRPTSLPLGTNNGSQSHISLSTTLQPQSALSTSKGVSISFTAPLAPVARGRPFLWKGLVINHSARAVKLVLYPLPRIMRLPGHNQQSTKRHISRTSMVSQRSHDRRIGRDESTTAEVARAIMDENVLYAVQRSQAVSSSTDLVALTAEVRVGSLGPGQCHESEIEMVALRTGTLQVDTIRVVDLVREAEDGLSSPGVMVDIRDLPDVVAVDE